MAVWWPEFEVIERDGRLIVGPSPRVRRHNRISLSVALIVAVPVLLALTGMASAVPWPALAGLGALSAIGGVWSLRQALAADFELNERRDITFERAADRVTKKGAALCALSGITGVELKSYPSSSDGGPPDELALFVDGAPGGRIVLLKGLTDDLEEPAARIAAYVGRPRRRS